MERRLLWFLLAFAACGDDEIIPPERPVFDATPATFDAPPPPEMLRAEATAMADGAGAERVECTMYLDIFDLAVTADGWTAAAGGEVIRRSFDGEDLLFEFSALLGGEVSLTSGGGGAAEARRGGDQPDDAAPFWLSLEVITGEETGDYSWAGSWTCSPILPDNPEAGDLELDAPGTWTLAPAVTSATPSAAPMPVGADAISTRRTGRAERGSMRPTAHAPKPSTEASHP